MFGTEEYFLEFMSKNRHYKVVKKLETLKQGYEDSLKSLSADEAFKGSESSVRDLLAHSTGGFYQTMTRRILEEDTPDFGNRVFDIEKAWQAILERSIADVTEAYETAKKNFETQNAVNIIETSAKNTVIVPFLLDFFWLVLNYLWITC